MRIVIEQPSQNVINDVIQEIVMEWNTYVTICLVS
jgi:hypothetical protein